MVKGPFCTKDLLEELVAIDDPAVSSIGEFIAGKDPLGSMFDTVGDALCYTTPDIDRTRDPDAAVLARGARAEEYYPVAASPRGATRGRDTRSRRRREAPPQAALERRPEAAPLSLRALDPAPRRGAAAQGARGHEAGLRDDPHGRASNAHAFSVDQLALSLRLGRNRPLRRAAVFVDLVRRRGLHKALLGKQSLVGGNVQAER